MFNKNFVLMKGKTKFQILFVAGLLSIFSCGNRDGDPVKDLTPRNEPPVKLTKYSVPVSGNSFITVKPEDSPEVITYNHLGNWMNPDAVVSTYFRVSKSGKLNVGIKASVPDEKTSTIKVTINDTEKKVYLKGSTLKEYDAGVFEISKPGYVKVDIQGLERTGIFFADVTEITFSGEATGGENIFASNPDLYKAVRTGPSSDISFTIPKQDVEYFYNEVVISESNSHLGFVPFNFTSAILDMATIDNGKIIYFDILNDFASDPKKMPEDHKTIVNKKGDDISFSEFSDGGAVRTRGVLKYDWEIGKTYKFLVKVEPDGKNNVDYTAWFLPPGESSWKLIISLKKQKWSIDPTKKLFNFLENQDPNYGYLSNNVEVNPWVATKSGKWIPLTEATFSSFNVDVYQQRNDAIAGPIKNGFFLKNGGFFNETVTPNSKISIPENTNSPDIDFSKLP